MFNFDFFELMVVGIVALVVIGPERLPKVARMAGYWVGRFQRFMNALAEDINKEIEIDRLKEIQRNAEAEIMRIDERIKAESAETETVFAEAEYKINTMGKGGDAKPADDGAAPPMVSADGEVITPIAAIAERSSTKAAEEPVAAGAPAGVAAVGSAGAVAAGSEGSKSIGDGPSPSP